MTAICSDARSFPHSSIASPSHIPVERDVTIIDIVPPQSRRQTTDFSNECLQSLVLGMFTRSAPSGLEVTEIPFIGNSIVLWVRCILGAVL